MTAPGDRLIRSWTGNAAAWTAAVRDGRIESRRVATDGNLKLRLGSHHVDHRTPFAERWGGWFVTGSHGRMPHLGNVVTGSSDQVISLVPGGPLNVPTLAGAGGFSGYPSGQRALVEAATGERGRDDLPPTRTRDQLEIG